MIITAQDNRQYKTASRWIKVQFKDVTPRHRLYDYSDNGSLDCFIHNNRLFALGQFDRLTYPVFYEDDEGKLQYLSGYDCTQWYKPYLIEIDPCGEYIRLWNDVTEEE